MGALTLFLTLAAATAAAQSPAWSGSVSVQTHALERGLSYTGGRPGAQLGVGWDGAGGAYAGAQVGQACFLRSGCDAAIKAYAGWVWPVAEGMDVEAGLLQRRFAGIQRYSYGEVYAGLLGPNWQLRAFQGRDHYGTGQDSLYAEAELRQPLGRVGTLLLHAGHLRTRGGPAALRRGERSDLRAGLAWPWGSGGIVQVYGGWVERGGPEVWMAEPPRHTVGAAYTLGF